jgi:TctA family transporter
MSKYIVIVIMVIIGFMGISETMMATAQDYINQTNSTKSDKQKIIVTWLELNKTGDSPVISITSEDFWKIFEPLLKQRVGN